MPPKFNMTMPRRRLLSASILLLLCAGHPAKADDTVAVTSPVASTLSLVDAISAATSTSPTVLAARAQLTQAEAKVDQARAQTRLTLSFNSSVSESNAAVATPPPDRETFGSIVNSVTLPLPVGRRPGLAVAQAEAQAAAAKAQFDGAVRTQSNAVINAYFDLLKKKSQLVDAQLALDLANRQLDEAQLRNKAGDVPELDVIRAQTPVATAQAALAQASNAVDIAAETLNAAIGRSISTPVTVTAPPASSTTLSLDDVERLAVERSADIAAAKAAMLAQQTARTSAKLWREPVISLQASDTRSGDVTSFSRQDTIGASVTIPLSDGGLARGQVREAEASIDQAKANVDASTLSTQASAAAAYHNAISTQKVADASKTALDIAQTAYDKTTRGYHSGLFPLTDVLNAQAALTQTRNSYTQALFDAEAAQATLDELIGPGKTL